MCFFGALEHSVSRKAGDDDLLRIGAGPRSSGACEAKVGSQGSIRAPLKGTIRMNLGFYKGSFKGYYKDTIRVLGGLM